MGIFSFGDQSDDAPVRRVARSRARGSRDTRPARSSPRTEGPAAPDAFLLDPTFPEKQRARRRLVGALALVLAAVIVLPMVLDLQPKPVTGDIAIDIPEYHLPQQAPGTAEGGAGAQTARAARLSPAPAVVPSVPGGKQAAPSTSVASGVAVPAPRSKPSAAAPAAPLGGRFAVQLGVFQDAAAAKAWVLKLKAAGVSAYVERHRQADGSMVTLLRAGPFADRAAAAAAIAKVRAAGLAQS